ncbi:MAG TPA: AAA family ATPase [Gammaproteobacteria bacterium]
MENRLTSPETARFLNKDSVRLLQALHEFVIAGSGLMLVCGPRGSGKSELLDQFVQNSAHHWRLCRTSARANPDGGILLARIANCFDLRLFERGGKDPVAQLHERLADIERSMIPVIAIDDAEQLSDEAVEWLGRLLAQSQPSSGPRIVLFGDRTTHQRLAGGGIKFHHIEIQPLDLRDIGDFLRHLLHLSGHSGTFPFSQRQLRRIEKESGGWPGRIQGVAQELFAIECYTGQRWRFSVVVVLALLVLGLVIFYFHKTNDVQVMSTGTPPQQSHVAAPAEETTPLLSGTEHHMDETASALPSVSALQAAPAVEPDLTGGNPATEQSLSPRHDEVLESPAAQAAHIEGVAWIERQPRTNYTLQVMVASAPGTILELAKGAGDTASPMAVASFTQDGRQLSLLLYGSYATRSEAESAATRVEASFRMRPWIRRFAALPALSDSAITPSAASTTSATASTATSSAAVAGAAWLWSRNPGHYTIQLMGDGQRSSLHNFVARYHPAGPLAMIRVARGGEAWHLLVAGEYESAAEAAAAVAALPDELKARAPWPRQFCSLQDQMAALGN